MNKFLTFQGQQPIYLGDFDFFDKSVRETLADLVQSLTGGESPVILSGCEMTQSSGSYGRINYTWTAGVVVLDGEVLPIDAGNASGTAQRGFRFIIETSYDDTGKRQMKAGNIVDCYQIRKAVITGITDPTVKSWELDDVKRFDDILADKIKSVSPGEQTIADITEENKNDIVDMALRLYKIGSSYYIGGTFYMTGEYLHGQTFPTPVLYSTEIPRSETLSSIDIQNLTQAKISSGITLCQITAGEIDHVDGDYNIIPALVEITQGISSNGIALRIRPFSDIGAGFYGNFFTRLNTL